METAHEALQKKTYVFGNEKKKYGGSAPVKVYESILCKHNNSDIIPR